MVSHVDTRATINSVRTKMSNLDQTMRTLESDIEKFNEYVIGLVEQLQARGQETQDLLVNLFKGYKACKDLEFVDYIKKKEDMYEEGGDVSPEQLMEWGLNKYKTRQENQTWCQKSDEEETIIALQAQVQSLISKQKGGSSGKSAAADKKKSKGKSKNDYRAPWTKEAPNEGEHHTKEVDGKEWHWCPTHAAWVRHKAEECKGLGFRQNKPNNAASAGTNNGPAMRLANALSAVDDEEDDDDDDE
jgi:prefoldin subunit 5